MAATGREAQSNSHDSHFPSFFPESVPFHVRALAQRLGISEEHALEFTDAVRAWQARIGRRVSFDYESLAKTKSTPMGRVSKVILYGDTLDTLDARGELIEQSVVITVNGRSYRVWPEDRAKDVQELPAVHPLAALVKDIEFSRCGRDGEMRLRGEGAGLRFLRFRSSGLDSRVWSFDVEAFSLLYVFPTDMPSVVAACPSAFPSLDSRPERSSQQLSLNPCISHATYEGGFYEEGAYEEGSPEVGTSRDEPEPEDGLCVHPV